MEIKKNLVNSVVWIRHIEKLYKNGKADKKEENQYQHDPGIVINEETLEKVKVLVSELVKEYGIPKTLIVSPYLRTRETSKIFLKELENINITPDIIYSTDIAEYLGFCKRENPRQEADLDPETKKHFKFKVFLGEGFKHFKKRIVNHINYTQENDENVWVITHGLVLSSIYEKFVFNSQRRPKPLDYVVKHKHQIIKSF
jgi:broad specificity phosphatase PhoE